MCRWCLSPPLFQSGICNFSSNSKFHNITILRTTLQLYISSRHGNSSNSIVFFLLPEAFCSLKYAENAIGDPAERAHDAPTVGWGADTPHKPHPTRRLWGFDARAFGASIVVPPPPLTSNPGDATGHHHFLR